MWFLLWALCSSNPLLHVACDSYTLQSRPVPPTDRRHTAYTPTLRRLVYLTSIWPWMAVYLTFPRSVPDAAVFSHLIVNWIYCFETYFSCMYMECLNKLNLWTLQERRNRSYLIEVFKMAKNLSPIPLTKFFELNTNNRTCGHSFKLVKHRCNCEVRRHFFSERVVNRW